MAQLCACLESVAGEVTSASSFRSCNLRPAMSFAFSRPSQLSARPGRPSLPRNRARAAAVHFPNEKRGVVSEEESVARRKSSFRTLGVYPCVLEKHSKKNRFFNHKLLINCLKDTIHLC